MQAQWLTVSVQVNVGIFDRSTGAHASATFFFSVGLDLVDPNSRVM